MPAVPERRGRPQAMAHDAAGARPAASFANASQGRDIICDDPRTVRTELQANARWHGDLETSIDRFQIQLHTAAESQLVAQRLGDHDPARRVNSMVVLMTSACHRVSAEP